jgi:UDP-N-acetyl-alpha-D-quinovosamine dehydrogenase
VKRVLVTGASGFVGALLCTELTRSGYVVRAAVRDPGRSPEYAAERVVTGNLGEGAPWDEALNGVDAVVHLAARAHMLGDSRENSVLYRQANALGTLHLARQAAAAGIRRFVFVSSVKVNGEATTGQGFDAADHPRPRDAYAESKWEGEKYAVATGEQSGMEVAIVRSPLMYGPGVKANFLRLMRWVDRERLLPLGSIRNKRSLVNIWNLCDLLRLMLTSPIAPGRIWMASDGEDLSTPELVRRIAGAMNRRARLLPVPMRVLQLLGLATGHGAEVRRLCGSLCVNIEKTREELGWSPPVSVTEGLERTVRWYLSVAGSRVH